jgi:hypothetical protein
MPRSAATKAGLIRLTIEMLDSEHHTLKVNAALARKSVRQVVHEALEQAGYIDPTPQSE